MLGLVGESRIESEVGRNKGQGSQGERRLEINRERKMKDQWRGMNSGYWW